MKRTRRTRSLVLFALLLVGAALTVVPFVYMVSTALKGPVFVFEMPPRLIPLQPTLENFVKAFSSNDFGRYFLNSLLVTIVTVVGVLVLGSWMAYALARYRFPGRSLVYGLVLFFMTMPAMSLLVPQFVLANRLRLTDTLLGLMVGNVAQNLPLAVFILTGFLQAVPRAVEEAAEIDGASAWAIYRVIVLPLCRPALATVAIFAFLGSWDEYVWASTITTTPSNRTLPVAIALYQGVHATNWGLVFAASLVAVIPVLIVFVALQRYFVRGLVGGAVKG